MRKENFVIAVLVLVTLSIYLFIAAPPPLEANAQRGKLIPVETMFKIVAQENASARALYTQEIVGPGQKAGLKFDENWRKPEVEAGPLPALLLRETALGLEKHGTRLNLFLGSDFPIVEANKFVGKQGDIFKKIRENRQAQFFYSQDTKLYTAMFPDLAAAPGCVSCHNQHAKSSKKDWQINDVMGATTWSYEKKEVTIEETLQMVASLRQSVREAYEAYLKKAKTYTTPPEIGAKWPKEGYFLPDAETFTQELTKRSSVKTIELLLSPDPSATLEAKK